MKLDALRKKLPWYVFALVLFQPVLDCISFWLTRLELGNSLTLVLRLGVLAVTALLGFVLSRRKWVYAVAAAVCIAIAAGHVYALYDYGAPASIVSDLTNYIRVVQLPVMTLCLITFLRENEDSYAKLRLGMVGSLVIILLVTVLASVTGTEPHTYVDGKGYIGWFNTTNAQSNILCLVVPTALVWVYEKKGTDSVWFWLTALLGFGAMFLLGTRLALFAMVAAGFGLGLSLTLIAPKLWKRGLCFILAAVVFVLLLPWSPMNSHQGTFDNVQSNRQTIADNRLEAYGLSKDATAEEKAACPEALHDTYYYHAYDFVKIFGMEQTLEHYHYSSNVAEITAQRPKKLLFGSMLMENSPASAKLFGVELQRFTVGRNNYDVENDLHGIWFLYGAVGLGALLVFLAYFVLLVIRALCKDAKTYFTMDAAGWGVGLVCCMMHVYLTAGVLRRPNSSFYLAAALAAVYYLTKVKSYGQETR
ncbi:MAG: O-antigen ligase family protein [Oscillospiraceae bacterium]|nr:O-antigen ligase family protein [Oscillospiraceae bacterium]